MAEVHGWLGLIAGWFLFAMFLTGTASYFRPEITRWMQPERRASGASTARATAVAAIALARLAPDAERWTIFLPTTRDPEIRAFVRRAGSKIKPRPLALDPDTGAPIVARETNGGEFFYRFHYSLGLPDPWGKWLAGACGMAMLGAIASGVITHKRILADLFTMRWGKGQRSWLDAHNLVAVVGLPYHAVITYSGLVTLASLLMPVPILAIYGTGAGFAAEVYADGPVAKRSGIADDGVPLASLVADAERRWAGVPASSVTVQYPGDRTAIVSVAARSGTRLAARGPTVAYDAADGRMRPEPRGDGSGAAGYKAMFGLHLGLFAGTGMRLMFAFLGLCGTAMVATGLILWTAARARRGPHPGHRIVQRLNVATITGLPAAMAGYFLANRLIPAHATGRATGEVLAFYGVWAALAVAVCLRPLHRAWIEGLTVVAALALAVPIADMATVGLPRDALFAGFDAAMLAAAAAFGIAARRTARPRTPRLHVHGVRTLADVA